MGKTKIEWATDVWNPVTGCTKVSEGCRNCYAERMAKRLKGAGLPQYQDVVDGRGWTGLGNLGSVKTLNEPSHWRKPRRVFVCSMSDLFHEDWPEAFLDAVFDQMIDNLKHTFMLLTKRPKRMRNYINWRARRMNWKQPPANIWCGVSVEDQATADERIAILLDTPAAVRFVSYEPALGPIDLDSCIPFMEYHGLGEETWPIHWVIAGGEIGPGARPAHPDWFRSVRDQCVAAGVPFFFKQRGDWLPIAKAAADWKTDRPREFQVVDGMVMARVGRKKAGRLLGGREYNEFPEVQA